ncbi:MAG TPA: flagellar motor switch protein FliG [Alphaproteobacteria bacterium]
MATNEDFRGLTGPQKAAMLMLSVGEEQATKLFSLMDDDEIREVSQAMASLGRINSEMVERLFAEFIDQISATGSLHGSIETAERLLAKVMPKDRVDGIMEDLRGPAGRTMWDKLGNVNEEVLANYLKNEYPQTIALVLSRVRADHAARVLELLPEDIAVEVMMRMLRMEMVQKEVLDSVEKTLRTEFMSNLARSNRRDAHEMMAEIFNNFDRENEQKFIAILEERNRDAAEKIKALMFTFDDLTKLDASGIQTLIRAIEKEKLAMALKGASEKMRDMFFANMSERAGKLLKEEMQAMGAVRLKDVDEAQMAMVNLAKELADKGEIVISDGADDQLVY